jgi:hypothetical protein
MREGYQAAQRQPLHHFHPLLLNKDKEWKPLKREWHKIFNFTHEGGDQAAQRQPLHHFHPLLLQGERMGKHLKREWHKIISPMREGTRLLSVNHCTIFIHTSPTRGENGKTFEERVSKIFNFTHEGGNQAAQHQPNHFHPLLLQGENGKTFEERVS